MESVECPEKVPPSECASGPDSCLCPTSNVLHRAVGLHFDSDLESRKRRTLPVFVFDVQDGGEGRVGRGSPELHKGMHHIVVQHLLFHSSPHLDPTHSTGDYGLLIDGTVKATAFNDMVVAVSSLAHEAETHFSCRCG